MKLLLDTHIFLWALSDDARLPEQARELILDERNEVYYSLLSLWEIELKHLAHSEAMTISAQDVASYGEQAGYLQLPLRGRHIYGLSWLRRAEDALQHKDPFDRLLICQASAENMLFVTHDARIAEYQNSCIVAV